MAPLRFSGFPYPITKDPRGYFHVQGGVDQIRSDLLQLLLTNPGERVMESIGTPLRTLLFQPNDATLANTATAMIGASVSQWEPRIAVSQISAQPMSTTALAPGDTGSDQVLGINISFFDPQNIATVADLDLEVPLQGS